MHTGAQGTILNMLKTRKIVMSHEFVREVPGWGHVKVISRLIEKGEPIKNVAPAGSEGIYLWMGK